MKSVKKAFIAVCSIYLVIGLNICYAQSRHSKLTKSNTDNKYRHDRFVASLLKKPGNNNLGNSARKIAARTTTEIAERLIAQSDYGYFPDSTTFLPVWELVDSFRYKYSSDRSSYFDYNFMDYSNAYVINGAGVFGFGSTVGFDDHNNLPDMLCDTSILFQTDPYTFIYGLSETRYAHYDTNNYIFDYADYYASGIGWQYINTYDTLSNITTSLALSLDTPLWDTSEYRLFNYNSMHQLIMDSTNQYWGIGTWGPEEKYLYTFDTSGNIIQVSYYLYDTGTGIWGENYRYILTYYTGSQLQTLTAYYVDTTFLQLNSVDSFGWSPGLYYEIYNKHENYSFGYMTDYVIFSKHVATDSLPDSMYTIYYDTTNTPYGRSYTSYIYDSYSEPTLATTYIYNNSTGLYDSLNGITHYYYELYESRHAHNNSVPNIPITNANVKVFPNPAGNTLNISCPGIAAGAYTYVSLTNASGQTLRTEALPWLSETESISMQGLIPGIYWLSLRDAKGKTFYRQAVVKQ